MNTENLHETGKYYERLAGTFLEKQGLQILEYNYRCRRAEIDIVAKDGDTLVFCEVKSRSQGDPLEAVNRRKQLRISYAALSYITRSGCSDMCCRFDVIGITGDQISWIKNAFDYITGV